jgi:hypothetical protein
MGKKGGGGWQSRLRLVEGPGQGRNPPRARTAGPSQRTSQREHRSRTPGPAANTGVEARINQTLDSTLQELIEVDMEDRRQGPGRQASRAPAKDKAAPSQASQARAGASPPTPPPSSVAASAGTAATPTQPGPAAASSGDSRAEAGSGDGRSDGRSGEARGPAPGRGRRLDVAALSEAVHLTTLLVGTHSRQLREAAQRDNLIIEIPSGPDVAPLRAALQEARLRWKKGIPQGGGKHPEGPMGPHLWRTLCDATAARARSQGDSTPVNAEYHEDLAERSGSVVHFGPLGSRKLEAGPPDGVWIWVCTPNPHTDDGRLIRTTLMARRNFFGAWQGVEVREDSAPMLGVERRLREVVLGESHGKGKGKGAGEGKGRGRGRGRGRGGDGAAGMPVDQVDDAERSKRRR